jgi:ABC-type multidrug transport system fused ATPase/permease subunit
MKNPYISLLRASWHYAGYRRPRFVLIYSMMLVAQVIAAMHPLLYGWFVGRVQNDTAGVMKYTLWFAAIYLGLKLTEWSLHGPARVMERTLAFHMGRNFMQKKYYQTLRLNAKWHQDHHSGATINRLQKASGSLRSFFDRGFMFFHTITRFVFSVGAILYFSPLFGSIAVALGALTVWVITRFDKAYINALKEVTEKEHIVSSNLFDTLSNIRTVITLRLQHSMEKGLLHKLRQTLRPIRRYAAINEKKWFVADMMISLIYCVVVTGFVYQHWTPGQAFLIAPLVILLGYVNQFTSVFQNVAGQYASIIQYETDVKSADYLTEAYEEQIPSGLTVVVPTGWKEMEIRNLRFSYDGTDVGRASAGLHHLNFRIARGEKVALIGASGSGKSTLLSLMRGLYTPVPGAEFRIDGQVHPFNCLHEAVTLFPQEPEIFENTLAYNITLGVPVPDQNIMDVCDSAHFSEVVDQLPEGLNTDIREKGVNLSGGQKQRLALARGIMAAADSQLVLLDEPTSSVDPRTEMQIYRKLFETFSDKAVVSSIHRLHLLPLFDYIYIMDKGRIVAEGSFNTLLYESELFQEMWGHQKVAA